MFYITKRSFQVKLSYFDNEFILKKCLTNLKKSLLDNFIKHKKEANDKN